MQIAAERQETREKYSINKCVDNISKCLDYDTSTLMRFDRFKLLIDITCLTVFFPALTNSYNKKTAVNIMCNFGYNQFFSIQG
jgi:hypothetical protein